MKLNKKEFDKVFEELGTGKKVLLLSRKKIETSEDIYFASKIYLGWSFGVRYLFWHGAGSSANDYTKRDLHFITENLFSECKFFELISWDDYNEKITCYLYRQFEERRKELDEFID